MRLKLGIIIIRNKNLFRNETRQNSETGENVISLVRVGQFNRRNMVSRMNIKSVVIRHFLEDCPPQDLRQFARTISSVVPTTAILVRFAGLPCHRFSFSDMIGRLLPFCSYTNTANIDAIADSRGFSP